MPDSPPANRGSSPVRAFLGACAPKVEARLAAWSRSGASGRVWKKDPTFWPEAAPSDVESRLGWLHLPTTMAGQAAELRDFAREIRSEGFEHVLLLGMGGSSLAPEVFSRTFGAAAGSPELHVLDSTHPAAVRTLVKPESISRTLFVVSSKSGTTLEPNAFFRYAWARTSGSKEKKGRQFVAITDPGTPLEALARERGFRRCFTATSDVGGRYSALTDFGLVPLAAIGRDPAPLLASAAGMARACGPGRSAEENPGLALGAALGELALAGRDKVVFVTSAGIRAFPSWIEQLIAESLGKQGRGIVPIPDEDRPTDPLGARDTVLVDLRLRGESDARTEQALDAAESQGIPVLRFELASPEELGQEVFRWELAIASAGAVIGVNPFDQPDVELAKELAREAMTPKAGASASPVPPAVPATAANVKEALSKWLASARPGDYVAIQAFLAPTDQVRGEVARLAAAVRNRSRLATTEGFGPRFLHSTGQLHKGGPPTGLFLQFIDEPTEDVEVPEMSISFARILRAQAEGDAAALLRKQRRLARIDVGPDAAAGLRRVREAVGA